MQGAKPHRLNFTGKKAMIAFLGMGHLGANFVRALLKKGETVNVWNRTFEKAEQLEPAGARAFAQVLEAVSGAERIHLTLKDDASVDEILAQAESGLLPGAWIIDHTTTTARGAAQRTEYWKAKGFTYLHAPVFMGPQNALESTGSMLVSGDQELIATIEPELAKMTGKVLNFGPVVHKAAGIKLIGNLFLIAMTGGLADGLALAKSLDIPAADISTLLSGWNLGGMMPLRLQKITSNTFDQPSWELSMARKDAGLMMHEAMEGGMHLMAIPAIASAMDQCISEGLGSMDWTVIAQKSL